MGVTFSGTSYLTNTGGMTEYFSPGFEYPCGVFSYQFQTNTTQNSQILSVAYSALIGNEAVQTSDVLVVSHAVTGSAAFSDLAGFSISFSNQFSNNLFELSGTPEAPNLVGIADESNRISTAIGTGGGGFRYEPGDILLVNGGTFTEQARVYVRAVAGGAVREIGWNEDGFLGSTPGRYTSVPPNPITFTYLGSRLNAPAGCTLNATWVNTDWNPYHQSFCIPLSEVTGLFDGDWHHVLWRWNLANNPPYAVALIDGLPKTVNRVVPPDLTLREFSGGHIYGGGSGSINLSGASRYAADLPNPNNYSYDITWEVGGSSAFLNPLSFEHYAGNLANVMLWLSTVDPTGANSKKECHVVYFPPSTPKFDNRGRRIHSETVVVPMIPPGFYVFCNDFNEVAGFTGGSAGSLTAPTYPQLVLFGNARNFPINWGGAMNARLSNPFGKTGPIFSQEGDPLQSVEEPKY